jgi:putative MFS transporter
VGRIGGIIGPYLTPVLVTSIAVNGTFAVFMILLVVTAGAVALLGEETRGRSLEEIAPEAEAA